MPKIVSGERKKKNNFTETGEMKYIKSNLEKIF